MTILNILPMSLMVESGEEQEKIVRANSYCAMLQLALIKTTKNFRGGNYVNVRGCYSFKIHLQRNLSRLDWPGDRFEIFRGILLCSYQLCTIIYRNI